ncbi:MAG TPA: hypothetical protein VFZ23_17110 [Pyrinomonadaceae bacterium]
MKNYIAGSIATTALIIFVFGFEASAQTANRLVADIPFDFYVRNEKLPAGKYMFERTSELTFPTALIVRSVDGPGRRSIIVSTIAGDVKARTSDGLQITFNRYGSVFYLSGLNLAANSLSLKILKTSAEREMARLADAAPPVTISPAISGH